MSENAGGPTSEPLRVALLGCGVVGSSVARLLTATAATFCGKVLRPFWNVASANRFILPRLLTACPNSTEQGTGQPERMSDGG